MFMLGSFLFYMNVKKQRVAVLLLTEKKEEKKKTEKVTVNSLCLQVNFGQYR